MSSRNRKENKKRGGSADDPAPKRRRRPGAISILLGWPFHVVNLVTKPFSQPLRFLLRLAGYPAVLGLMVLLVLALIYGWHAQSFDLRRIHAMPERSIIYDRLGEELGRIHGEKRSIVPLKDVSEHFRKAILAREDERFYHHPAVDPIGMVRAVVKNFEGKREGASTITQQLASDVFQLKRGEKRGDVLRQLNRKFLEIAIALRIESWLEKDEILEAYINQINWGRQIKGVGEASRIYFEKHPAELTLSESALLAGIVRGPDSFNPFRSLEASTRERNTTLARMVAAKAITQAEADAAKQDPIEVRPAWRRHYKGSFAMNAIREDLELILEEENIELGGLEIITTFDKRIQETAEEALEKKLASVEKLSGYPHQTRAAWLEQPELERGDPRYLQGAVVVVENRTGGVLALVGGRNANESWLNRATAANRQVGSIFKPFVYLAGFEKGVRPGTPVSDGPLRPGEIKGGGTWRPRNSDGKYGGEHPASYGLIRSRNTMSIRVGDFAGIDEVAKVAKNVGFNTPMPRNPSSFLGSWEATPWEVASAYTIFPNEGKRFRPFIISQIKDRDGNVLFSTLPIALPGPKREPSAMVSRILKEVATSGTAASVKRLGFDKPCGGKTGTTNDFKDAWFAGFTSSLTCTVWVGLDKPKTTIRGGYGSVLALPVWVDVMKTADRLGYRAGRLNDNSGPAVTVELCHLSGKRATAGCRAEGKAYIEVMPADLAPPENDYCPHHPAKALTVDDSAPRAGAAPDPTPPRAAPVRAETPRKAVPVEDEAPRKAIPVR